MYFQISYKIQLVMFRIIVYLYQIELLEISIFLTPYKFLNQLIFLLVKIKSNSYLIFNF